MNHATVVQFETRSQALARELLRREQIAAARPSKPRRRILRRLVLAFR
jgi:hypothetical protein